jgi:nitrate/nitrite transporter NarK
MLCNKRHMWWGTINMCLCLSLLGMKMIANHRNWNMKSVCLSVMILTVMYAYGYYDVFEHLLHNKLGNLWVTDCGLELF